MDADTASMDLDRESMGATSPSPGHKQSTDNSTPASGGASASAPAPSGQSKRKRGPGIVTANACTECRKKRAKCDGQKPCGRCRSQKDVECVYEVPVRQSKETLRNEIDQLRRRNRSSDSVLAALGNSGRWEEILQRLRSGQSVESISEWLEGTLPSGGGALPLGFGPTPGSNANLTPLASFTGANLGPFTGRVPPLDTMSPSPVSGQHPASGHPQSPWGGGAGAFSTHSHPASAQSESHTDALSWNHERRGGPLLPPISSRIGTWIETITESQEPPQQQHHHQQHHQQQQHGSRPPQQPPQQQHRQPLPSSPSPHGTPRYRGADKVLAPHMPNMKIPAEMWTDITSDSQLVQHLLALYFCWEYPTFASLSKEHFLRDFEQGRQRYCSPILVNALLALGCRFSSQPSTRAVPDDPYTSGDHFFKESQRLFYLEHNHHTLTTIQALGIMSIREASCGRDSESWYFAGQSIRLAVEMGLHRVNEDHEGDEDETAVQAATFWGAFALDHAWSLATGSLPQCSCFPHLPPKPGIIDDIEASLWIPYTDDGAPLQRSCEQPSNVRSVYKCFCELSELVHQSLYILHSPGRPLTSRDLLNIYTQYLNWYDKIPEVLRLGHNFTPAVLFAHMYYHFAILLLFRPLIKLRIIGSSITPRDVCAQAADAIQGLLRSYSQLYTLRRTPSFVPYFVLTSSIMHLAIGASKNSGPEIKTEGAVDPETPSAADDGSVSGAKIEPRVAEAIKQGIADLTEMAPCHHFAEQALSILRYLAKKWHIEVDIEISDRDREHINAGGDLDGGVRPMTQSLNFFAPNVTDADFMCSWGVIPQAAMPESGGGGGGGGPAGGGGGASGGGGDFGGASAAAAAVAAVAAQAATSAATTVSKSATTMENPLFWPFPMQGRPMLPSGKLLRDAGFELL